MPITFTAVPKGSQRKRLDLGDIPQDVIDGVNEAFEWSQEHPDERLSSEWGSKEAAEEFLFQARSYAYQAEPRLTVTGNSTKSGAARIRVELYAASDDEQPAELAATA